MSGAWGFAQQVVVPVLNQPIFLLLYGFRSLQSAGLSQKPSTYSFCLGWRVARVVYLSNWIID